MTAKPAITLLVLIFVGPIVLSWFFVNSDINWAERGLSNHGELINPSIDLRGIDEVSPLFDYAMLAPSDWALVSVETEPCGLECEARIDKLISIHTVMGSSRTRVRVFGLAPAGKAETNALLIDDKAVSTLQRILLTNQPNIEFPQFLVMDWRKQLMLRFPAESPPGDIKKDLSKLLRASKIR
ncbi:MAG: hypothetical protein ACU84Q_06110 [Gammaproteobacteria bacterium]